MFKWKMYNGTRFRRQVLTEADHAIGLTIPPDAQLPQSTQLRVCLRDEFYKFDTIADFLTEVEHGPSMYKRDCGNRWGLGVFTCFAGFLGAFFGVFFLGLTGTLLR